MVEVEKKGFPAVGIIAHGFEHDFELSVNVFGLDRVASVVVPSAFTNISAEDIRKEIGKHTEEIIRALTTKVSSSDEKSQEPPETIRITGEDWLETYDKMNHLFLKNGWSDGFPLVPPTLEKVRDMLSGTTRPEEEQICVLDPGGGIATVRKIAVNAVMAGCLPAHLPVIIAAVEAMSDPAFELRGLAMSTGPHTTMLIVNGPVTREIGMNSGQCTLGPGAPSFVNTVIGRAIRLILMNIGQAYPGQMDLDTIGSPNKYSMCIAENENQNPWQPLHVERGFRREDSTVTVFGAESQMEMANQVSTTPEDLLRTFTGTAASAGCGGVASFVRESPKSGNIILIAPEHAAVFSRAGWSKHDVKDYMFHHSRIQWRYLKNASMNIQVRTKPAWKWIWDAPEDTWLPVAASPDWFNIVVVGGPAGKSSYITGHQLSVTKLIKS